MSLGSFRVIPGSFLPEEDQGYFITIVQLPDGASKQTDDAVLSKVESYFLSNPVIHSTDAFSGQNFVFNTRGPNSATMFVPLQHWDKRTAPHNTSRPDRCGLSGIRQNSGGPHFGLQCSRRSVDLALRGVSVPVQDPSGGDFNKFSAAAKEFVAKARENPAIGGMRHEFRVSARSYTPRWIGNTPRHWVCPISEVFDTMQAYFGNLYINDFIKFGRVYRVQTEAERAIPVKPEDISEDLRARHWYARPR